jgi:hypothetical protein
MKGKVQMKNILKVYHSLLKEWVDEWKEDNGYLAKQDDLINYDGSFKQNVHQTSFEVYFDGMPDYCLCGDGFWVPSKEEFIKAMIFVNNGNDITEFEL